MRRVGVMMAVLVAALVAVAGCTTNPGQPGSPGPPAVTRSAPTLITMPDVVDENAAVAVDS